jgi:hypothetical protein
MKEHEFLPANTHGFVYCKYCGVRKHDAMHETCLERPDAGTSNRPRQMSAIDDIDTIHNRLAELRREQSEALSKPAEIPAASCLDELDLQCG